MWLLRKLSFPVSLVYGLVVHLRNYLYEKGVFKSKSFGIPTVCIGNLSVGGTGKTPMIEFLISQFKENSTLVVLSRGYGRKTKGFFEANSKSTVEEIGDEPFQIQTKFPKIQVVVDADRSNAISLIENKFKPGLILLDDAFQHRKVKPSISILLTTYQNLYTNDWYLPTGNLRDSKKEAKRAKLIVITKCPNDLNDIERERVVQELKPKPYQEVLFSYLEYGSNIIGSGATNKLDHLVGKKITLVTGIANPKPLLEYLMAKSIVFEHLKYRDHHFFTDKEIALLNKKEVILTTEKDFVRLKDNVENVFYIPIEHKFIGNGKEIIVEAIRGIMKQYP